MAATTERGPAEEVPSTLFRAHEVLLSMRPDPAAPPARWRAFRLYSARIYRQVADVDRGHHHEALYFAQYERDLADELGRRIERSPAETAR
ncbi:hypothetical protein CFN78_08875 [Amycolatopsis antarctica]|uniref:Uncharacterized protein n=1 Tax=Amycolatopsis antarctica TaxID=1854586 RepID=A0A263D593_9PSEU|nr:AMED_5909 family protein [Amycolatopsis antarctica]OZM73630.1 hypothetical protein CFN78_08875 [Amycolatopsis antarctica]